MSEYYFYVQDEFCFYICHKEYDFKIPLQKCSNLTILSEQAVVAMINKLNEDDSDLMDELNEKIKVLK